MLDPGIFLNKLRALGVEFFTGVPDSLLKNLCAELGALPGHVRVTAANEGGAVALAAGHYLGTGAPALVYMQNSGQGNAFNPLVSLAAPEVYGIPMLLLVGWRGQPGGKDEPQHVKQGIITRRIFEGMDIPCEILSEDWSEAEGQLARIVGDIRAREAPAALLVRGGTFQRGSASAGEESDCQDRPFPLSREKAIERVLACAPEGAVFVSTTGHISRELYECRERSGVAHERDFLTVGSMGHASQIAMGLALSRPDRPVLCLDGDGAVLMHMGALAIIGQSSCRNLYHVVLNNGAHDSVGGQRTVALQIDLVRIAEACGYRHVATARVLGEIEEALESFSRNEGPSSNGGPSFLEIRVSRGHRDDLGRPRSSPERNKRALRGTIGERAPEERGPGKRASRERDAKGLLGN